MLWTHGHERMGEELWASLTVAIEDLLERNAKHLPALIEHSLHNTLEKSLIAAKIGNLISSHANNSRLHLWRRVEHRFIDSEQIFSLSTQKQ